MSTLTIGKLASTCDVTVDTIRYYEKRGLLPLPDRTNTGYRIYSSDHIKHINFIRRTQSLGFTLEEIKSLLTIGHEAQSDCSDIQTYARKKIIEIDTRINDLLTIKHCLQELTNSCPGKGRPLSECSILQYFYGDQL